MQSLFDAFGVVSPKGDTKQIPLDQVCPVGALETTPDPAFQFEYRTLRRTLRNIADQRPIWCWGPSGCGKTEFFIQIAARLRRPCHVVSFGEETSLRELLGSFELKAAESGNGFSTAFRYGHLVKAMREPGALVVLDEFNMAPASVAAQFNRLLETGSITIPETGETITAAENVVFLVTANTPGSMDESGIYAGSQTQNGATRSRFSGLKMDYLPPDKEVELLRAVCPRLDAVIKLPDAARPPSALIVECGNMIRALVNDGAVSLPFTVRQLKTWAMGSLQLHDIRDAFCDAYHDLLSSAETVPVSEVFHKVFGVRVED